jgi:hypothetical protein
MAVPEFSEMKVSNCQEDNKQDTVLDSYIAPDDCWLLANKYFCYLLNHNTNSDLGDCTPLEIILGITPDISALLRSMIYEIVYYLLDGTRFPSESIEHLVHFCFVVACLTNMGRTLPQDQRNYYK